MARTRRAITRYPWTTIIVPPLFACVGVNNDVSKLPPELILLIIGSLDDQSEINALARVSRQFYSVINPVLYKEAHIPDAKVGKHGSATRWAAARGIESTLLQALAAGESLTIELLGLAAKYGHAGIVKLLLEYGLDINAKVAGKDEFAPHVWKGEICYHGWFRGTPLSLAAENGREDVVRVLLTHGVATNYSRGTDYGRSPLAFAAHAGHATVVKMLLDTDAEIDRVDCDKRAPLQLAAYNGHHELVELLLNCGADPNAQDAQGSNPLKSAATRGYSGVVRCLLDRGADCSLETLHGLVGQYEIEIVELLLQQIDLVQAAQSSQKHCMIAACVAAAYGRLEVLMKLISDGLDFNAALVFHFDKFGEAYAPPLTWAVDHGRVDSVGLLLANNADPYWFNKPDDEDVFENQPLVSAVQRGHEEIVSVLIDHGADVNTKDCFGCTVLEMSVPHDPIFKLLLDKGAKFKDVPGKFGRPSVLEMIKEGNLT